MQLLAWYFFITAHAVLCACMAGLLARRLVRSQPFFFAYVVFALTEFAIFFTLRRLLVASVLTLPTYRWTMVVCTLIAAICELLVVYDISKQLILSRSVPAKVLGPLLRWAGAVLVFVSAGVSGWLGHPGIQRVMHAFETVNFSANLIVLGLLLVMLLFSRALEVPWASLPAGIVLGFGFNASAELAATALMSTWGTNSYIHMDMLRMSAFLGCTVIWAVYVFLPDKTPPRSIRIDVSQLEVWNNEVQRMVRR